MSPLGVELNSNGNYWSATWQDSTGRRRRKGLGPKSRVSRRAALQECRKLAALHAVTPAARDAGRAPHLDDWEVQYLALRHDLDELTLRLHRQTFTYLRAGHGIPAGARLDQVTRAHAAAWVRWLATEAREGQPLAVNTVRKHVRNAKVIFGRAVDLDLLTANPFDREVGAPPAPDRDWHHLGDADMAKLLDACPNESWQVLWGLCRWAGLRLGEAVRLRWQDIQWDERTMVVRAAKGHETTKQRRRVVPLQPRLYDLLLRAHAAAPDGTTRATHAVAANNLHRDGEAIVVRAGLAPWDKLFHTLRKNCESDWLAVHPVMDVCSWLGHAPAIAARHYHQTRPETLAGVTGASCSREQDALRAEIQTLRRRLRRVIAIAKKARTA